MQVFWQSSLLFLSFLFVFIWQETMFSQYTLETMIAMVVIFFVLSLLNSSIKKGIGGIRVSIDKPWSIFLLNSTLVLLVLATGNFSSPVFFLMYFLAFGIAFAFPLATIVVFMLGIVLLFLPLALRDDVQHNILLLGSLLALSPLAFFFGRTVKSEN